MAEPSSAPLSCCFIERVYVPDSGRLPGPGLLLRYGRLSGGAGHRSHGSETPEQERHRPGPGGAVQHLRGQEAGIHHSTAGSSVIFIWHVISYEVVGRGESSLILASASTTTFMSSCCSALLSLMHPLKNMFSILTPVWRRKKSETIFRFSKNCL